MNELTPQCDPITPGLPAVPCRSRLRALLLGMVILLCGVVIGSGATVIILHRVVIHAIHNPEEVPGRIARQVGKKLKLTREQTAKIKAILTDRQKALLAIRREVYPQVERELQKAKEQVAAILEPEKAKSWNERFDQLKSQWMPAPPAERR